MAENRSATLRKIRHSAQRRHRIRQRLCGIELLEQRLPLTAEIEPNDTIGTATLLPANELVEGQVLNVQDVDHFRIVLQSGDHFRLQTANTTDALFTPTLPPAVDLLDDTGRLLATTQDGRDLLFTAHEDGDYFVRMDARNAFGTFTESYSMQTTLTAFSGVGELEPNDDTVNATPLNLGQMFRGAISGSDASDLFSVDLNADDGLTFDFSGPGDEAPGVRLLDSNGVEVASASDGYGLSHVVTAGGTYYLDVIPNANGAVGDYSGVINRFQGATQHTGLGSGFADSTQWDFLSDRDHAIGRLDAIDDADVYRFEIDTFSRYNFNISPSGGDRVSDQSRVLTLFNEAGQFLAYSTSGSLTQERDDATAPGTYYLVVQPTGEAGTGSYGLRSDSVPWFAGQRDRATHFIDFNQQMPTHQGFNWVNDFAVTEAIPFVLGMFDARFSAYDVDVTTTLPTDDAELVTHGFGDFGDIGAGGFGGGSRGQRSTSGRAISSARQTSWTSLSYGSTATLNHEFGHAAGLPHARLPNAFMSYVTTNSVLPVGQGFSFRGTDSRRAGFSIRNERNYLDWSLQPGAQVVAADTSSIADALDLGPYFLEMQGELEPQPPLATERQPNLVRAGDINGDGQNDVILSNAGANSIQVFSGDGLGAFQLADTSPVNEIGWWTEPIVVRDFNGDGRDDVASISYSQQTVSILLGQPNGSLGNPTNISVGARPQSVAVADLDGDNVDDLVLATVNDQVRVMLGTGAGNFANPVSYTAGDNPYSITVGDFDGDGNVDVATANNNDDTLSVLLGNGDGTLQPASSITVAEDPRSIVAADFNGDGRDDLATVSRDSRMATVVLAAIASGFEPATFYPAHDEGQTVSVGDVNRDGQVDLLVGGFDVDFRVLLGNDQGTFSRPVSIIGGNSESSGVAANFSGDAFDDLVLVNYWSDEFALYTSVDNDPSNDAVVLYGEIDSADDVDYYSITAAAGQEFTFDIDSAEFQYPLDATLRLLALDGTELAANTEALDWNSGLDSLDPFLNHEFATAGTYVLEVVGQWQTTGAYRLKVTPEQAFDQIPPRMIAALPDAGATVNATREITLFFDDQIDPATLTSNNVVVRGDSAGVRPGTIRFDPLDSALVWRAAADLPPDTYTVTLRSGPGGLADTHGNLYDGELAANFAFPLISGDGTEGGDSQFSFTIDAADNTPAVLNSALYNRDPYQRGRLRLNFSDEISWQSVEEANLTLRGAGPDSQFNSVDDTIYKLDVNYDKINHARNRQLNAYSRGVPDPDLYRLEGTLIDAAGHPVQLNEELGIGSIVAEAALFRDDALTEPGLVGSYVDQSLRNVSAHTDWRTSQTISGTRTDFAVDFLSNSWGTRADVGVTGGTDANWDDFSAQWDGWISIPTEGTRLQTRSDDGSRLWVDVNGDGNFASDSTEFWDNGWGTGHGLEAGALTAPLAVGNYRIRIQYEEGGGGNAMALDWLTPGVAGEEAGYGHGPAVVGMNIQPGTAHEGSPLDRISVTFSGAIDTATLTPDNFQLWYSPDSDFFDGNDQRIEDADGIIAWNGQARTATLQPSSPLTVGYYRLELNGDADGIYNTAGLPLDGEFLNSYIPGNTNSTRWAQNPSGDGLPGGDYAALFSVAVVQLSLSAEPTTFSERDGQSTVTLYRLDPTDVGALTVQLTAEQAGRLNFPPNVTISPGADSTTFDISAIDNDLLEGTVDVVLTASSPGYRAGQVTVSILDYEELSLTPIQSSISERDGSTQIQVGRAGTVGELMVDLSNANPAKLNLPAQATIPDGQSFVLVDATAMDNTVVDGDVIVGINATAGGMLGTATSITVTDYEELTLEIVEAEIRETGGTSQARVTRTDPNGDIVVQLTSFDTSEATVPASITIPDGQTISAPFTITAQSDGVGDGDQTVTIRAEAQGYVQIDNTIDVLDDEALSVVIDAGAISERGGQTMARVRRLTDAGSITVQLSASAPGEVSLPSSTSIADGEFESAPFPIDANDNDLLDGSRTILIQANSTNYFPGSGALVLTDYEELVLAVTGATSISEKNGQTTVEVTRVDANGDLVVELLSSDTGELTVPNSIVIPDGALTSDPIVLNAADDQVLDGTQAVTVSVSALGYVGVSTGIQVEDVEELDVQLASSSISELEGQVEVTLFRLNSNPDNELTVAVEYSDATEITGPSEIVFEPFVTSKTFVVRAADDTELDGDQLVSLTFNAPSYEELVTSLTVTDYEQLSLTVDATEVSESDGQATATVSRPQAEATDLTVVLQSSDTSELTVPSSVTIPANEQSVTFPVQAVDDDLLDGDVSVDITATAADYLAVDIPVLVLDHETLVVTFADTAISEEDGTTRATVRRLGETDQQLTVSLSSSPAGSLILPQGVLIPAGSDSVQFTVRSIDDPEATGHKQIDVIASAMDYLDSSGVLEVLDTDPIGVSLTNTTLSEAGGASQLTITRGGTLAEMVVDVSVDVAGQLDVPQQITIPEGANSVTLDVTAIDNDLLDGTRDVAITVGGGAFLANTLTLEIIDAETVSLSLDTSEIAEDAGEVTGTVQRSNVDDTGEALVVQLTADPSDTIEFPAEVTIPAGQTQQQFTVTLLDDRVREPDVTVQFSVAATDYTSGSADLLIQDNDLFSWTNFVNPFDVNDDGGVSAVDALLVINELNSNGGRALPPPDTDPGVYYDVSEDEFLSAVDALMVINELNRGAGEAEGEGLSSSRFISRLSPGFDWELSSQERERLKRARAVDLVLELSEQATL